MVCRRHYEAATLHDRHNEDADAVRLAQHSIKCTVCVYYLPTSTSTHLVQRADRLRLAGCSAGFGQTQEQ